MKAIYKPNADNIATDRIWAPNRIFFLFSLICPLSFFNFHNIVIIYLWKMQYFSVYFMDVSLCVWCNNYAIRICELVSNSDQICYVHFTLMLLGMVSIHPL